MMSFFLCIMLYQTVQSSIDQNLVDGIYFGGFAIVMFSKTALTHLYGQEIKTKSEEVLNALYEVSWTEHDQQKKKDLIMLMIYNQKIMKINVMGFYDLDLKNFAKVGENLQICGPLKLNLFQICEATYTLYTVLRSVTGR
jgi:hypothetical protein